MEEELIKQLEGKINKDEVVSLIMESILGTIS
jgi:hypothetical protein